MQPPRSPQQRLRSWERSALLGTLDGRVLSASAVRRRPVVGRIASEADEAARLLFLDEFNRADSATTLGAGWTVSPGGQATVDGGSAVWGIQSNAAYPVSRAFNNTFGSLETLAWRDDGEADVDITITYGVAGSATGILFRATSALDSYFTVFRDRVAFNTANVFTFSSAADGDVMRVLARGSLIEVYLNAALVGSGSSSSNLTETVYGMWSSAPPFDTTSRVDRFEAWTAP